MSFELKRIDAYGNVYIVKNFEKKESERERMSK